MDPWSEFGTRALEFFQISLGTRLNSRHCFRQRLLQSLTASAVVIGVHVLMNGTRRLPSMEKDCQLGNEVLWRKSRDCDIFAKLVGGGRVLIFKAY